MAQKVLAGMTMSLDGYVTGPDDRPGAGLGEGGERLHYWVFGGPWSYGNPPAGSATGVDKEYLDGTFSTAGAWLVGRTMHDVVDGWGDDPGFGANLFGQYLEAGVIDEFTVTIAPVLLGSGKRLFGAALRSDLAFEQAGAIESPFATHLRYRPAAERRSGGEIA